ncbi:MAG: 50S ribosomal protein L32e [Candidatus Thorarchaeota archaeon]|nr:MAG: 50S ribosomal protein L32e [Candidatus Thorarchaeota archaeon]
MSKKPQLSDVPGIGAKMEEKLRDAGVKTVSALSKAKAEKLAAKVDGLSESGATKIIAAASELVSPPAPAKEKPKKKPTPKKAEAKPKTKPKEPAKKKAPPKKKEKVEPKKAVKKKDEPLTRDTHVDTRLWSVAQAKRRKQPKFRHEQAHRWIRVSNSWRKVRGIDSATREKKKGRPAMVSTGYRKPRAVRGIHPSRYVEILVHRPEDLEGLDPELHAIRIGGKVGLRKRQAIMQVADSMFLRVLNPGVPETIEEEELFADLEGIEDLEAD